MCPQVIATNIYFHNNYELETVLRGRYCCWSTFRRTGTNADSSRTGTVVEIKEVIKSIKEGSRSPHVKKILTKPLGTTESWITFVSWIISISIDPLFCYIAVINDEKKLLEINKSLLIVLFGSLRLRIPYLRATSTCWFIRQKTKGGLHSG
ncbi:hypothetical protein Q3G72_014241 [Acer saccharum]|nr:hypothetical protein Q3G72_014241 [Acer saccharum]